ncbi:regulation of enolase 1 [Xanthomonas alfalfae]|nr:regulation of enolase 1 [Xanthomonas alfalfae]
MQHDAFNGARRRVLAGVVGMTLSAGAFAQQTDLRKTMVQDSSWHAGTWLNRPKTLDINGDTLDVVTDQATDFWRKTHYGFTRDSGHFLGIKAGAGFTAQLRVRAQYEALYDQAGIMVRVDEQHWVKAGIELSDGRAMLSSVLTNPVSDWATGPYEADPKDFWIRATVADGVLRLQVSADGRHWPLVRLCPFPPASAYLVGPMCCTPERSGLKVRFSDWALSAPLGKDLHDLS